MEKLKRKKRTGRKVRKYLDLENVSFEKVKFFCKNKVFFLNGSLSHGVIRISLFPPSHLNYMI